MLSSKKRNKGKKIINGNGQIRNILTVVHWNLGARQWQRKIEEMEMLLLEKEPDLAFITDANLLEMVPDNCRNINGYSLILPKTMEYLKYSRIVLLVKNGVEIEVLNSCMEKDISAIWVKIGKVGRKPLVVGGVYTVEQEIALLISKKFNSIQEKGRRLYSIYVLREMCKKKYILGSKETTTNDVCSA